MSKRWKDARSTEGEEWLSHYKALLELRKVEIVSRRFGPGRHRMLGERAFEVSWEGGLTLLANCGDEPAKVDPLPPGRCFWGSGGSALEPWTASWWLSA